MKDIKTIIFDLGGVYFTDGTKGAIKTISEMEFRSKRSGRCI